MRIATLFNDRLRFCLRRSTAAGFGAARNGQPFDAAAWPLDAFDVSALKRRAAEFASRKSLHGGELAVTRLRLPYVVVNQPLRLPPNLSVKGDDTCRADHLP
jgi:hypothetical protein